MKKQLLMKTFLVAVCLLGGANFAWAVATTYDFEDDNVRFSAYNSAKITVAIQENSGPNSDSKAVKFAYKQKGAHNFAYLDFSSLVEDASTVNVAFDFYVTAAAGHDLISLADADYHTGGNAGFDSDSNTGYGSNGAIFNLGCYRASGTNDFAINSTKKTALTGTCLGNWCHADITVDNVGKTVSYTITRCDATVLDAAATATGVSFLNSSAVKCTQIDVYMGATSTDVPIYVDNLVITPTVVATNHSYVIKAVSGGTTLKTFAAGMIAEGSTYSSYVPKVINYDGKYYVLNDANLLNFNASYTMSTANITKEISYTLDESIVYYMEGESSGSLGTKVSNNNYSNGSAGRGLNGTIDIYTIPSTGKYTITSAVCSNSVGEGKNVTYSFYKNNSDNVLQTVTSAWTSVNKVLTDGTKTSDAAKLVKDDVIKFYSNSTNVILDYIIIRQTDGIATITSAGWATYCSPYALDFSGNIANLTDVYFVTGATGSSLNLYSVKGGTVPANTGLLIEGTAGDVVIPIVGSSTTNVDANKLVGVTAATPLAANGGYVLMGSPSVGFYQNSNAFTVGANTAYLPADFAATARSFYSFGDATGVSATLKNKEIENKEVYNLKGQRVAAPTKGLYIVNGKKVVVK